jgi:integrase
LIALRWSAVDLDAGTVRIEQTITRNAAGERVATSPKTAGSRRTIPISSELVTLLRQHRDRQRFIGAPDLVFPAPRTGTWLQQPAIQHALERACVKAGVPRISPHGIRHSGGSIAYRNGMSIKVISERLGHSSMAVTMGVYVHTSEDEHRTAADKVAALLAGH